MVGVTSVINLVGPLNHRMQNKFRVNMSRKCSEICKPMKSRQNNDRLSFYPNKKMTS